MKSKTFLYSSYLCIILALIAVSHSFTCTEEMYNEFLTHWGRNFTQEKTSPEYSTRMDNYCSNRRQVEQTNAKNLGYQLDTFWQWMDKSQEQRKKIVRVQFSPEAILATAVPIEQNGEIRKVSQALPSYVDYRISGRVSSVKNQGTCGCCWSFTTVGTYESWMMLKGQREYDLSQQYLLECTTKFTQNIKKASQKSTCEGGYINYSGQLAKTNGIPLEEKFPYIASTYTGSLYPETPGICEANETIMYARDPSLTKFTFSKNNSQTKMKELIAKGPVAALIYADKGFQSYKSGIYTGCPTCSTCSADLINHAVVIVGYDIYGNYIVKNSWGITWGMNGFGVVSKDTDCALSAYAFQYESDAPSGQGVLFYNQISLKSGYYHFSSIIFLVLMLMLAY